MVRLTFVTACQGSGAGRGGETREGLAQVSRRAAEPGPARQAHGELFRGQPGRGSAWAVRGRTGRCGHPPIGSPWLTTPGCSLRATRQPGPRRPRGDLSRSAARRGLGVIRSLRSLPQRRFCRSRPGC